MKLKLAEGLSLPLDAVTQKLAWLGVTGSGKTYGASKLAELMWHAGAQFVVVDPVGVWYGLRLAKGGKHPSDINIPIFGGLHGDVPLEPTGGALLANLIVDKTLSAIIDVSQFESDVQKARFAHDLADRLFFRKKAAPSAMHLFLEECQEFVPQNPMKGEEHMLHVFIRIQKLGRNFGIGSSYISQRPQEVNKKALNMAQTLFVFRTTGTHERGAIEKWIQDKALDQDIAGDLPKIPTGDCHVWSPEFLKISETVHILEKDTFNASATPEVGVTAKARELAPIDLDQVRADMAATIEKAKADDPRELRKQIAELKKQQALKSSAPVENLTGKVREKQVLTDADRELLKTLGQEFKDFVDAIADKADLFMTGIAERAKAQIDGTAATWSEQLEKRRALFLERLEKTRVQKILAKLATLNGHPLAGRRDEPTSRAAAVSAPRPRADLGSRVRQSTPPTTRIGDEAGVTPARQKILNALAFLHGIGVSPADKTQLALIVGVSPTSGGYFNNLGSLRSAGFIDYPTGGMVALTEAGQAIASIDGIPSTTSELHEVIRAKLPPAKWKLLEELIRVYPASLSKDELAKRIDVSPTSGGYFNNLGSLRSLGLITYPRPSEVGALPVLFLEELATR